MDVRNLRWLWALAAVLVLAGAWWLSGPVEREVVRSADELQHETGEQAYEPELLQPELPASAGQAKNDDDSSLGSAPGARTTVAPTRAPDRASIRARVLVAETLDPIEEELDVRLRSADLILSESLRTRPDGSFTSTREFPRCTALALVKNAEGVELVDHEAPFDPRSADEWPVLVPSSSYPTFLRGRVVDPRGMTISGARVQIVALFPAGPYAEAATDEDGLFVLDALRRGGYRLHVQGRWARSVPLELHLVTGPNEVGDVLLPEPAPEGDLLVRVVAAKREVVPRVMLELRGEEPPVKLRFVSPARRPMEGLRILAADLRNPSFARSDLSGRELPLALVASTGDAGDTDGTTLRIEGVPGGRYTLAIRGLDGVTYDPASCVVSPPATVEFRARGAAPDSCRFRARDSSTGDDVPSFSMFGRVAGIWELHESNRRNQRVHTADSLVGELRLPPAFDSWVAWSSDHCAAIGEFNAPCGDQVTVIELEPGWSELLLFEDAEADSFCYPGFEKFQAPPGLPDVEVFAGGDFLGRSDADGVLAVSAEGPLDLEFRMPGWRVVTEYRFGILRTVVLARAP